MEQVDLSLTTPTEGSGGVDNDAKPDAIEPVELEGLRIREDEAVEENKPGPSSGSLEMAVPPPENEQLQVHPLQNPVILDHLFERCPVQLLPNCRLVCKQWYDSSLTSFRSFSHLELDMNRFFPDRNYDAPISTTQLGILLEFLDNPVNKCEGMPFKCMRLTSWLHDRELSVVTSTMMQLWERHGRNLTTLIVKECLFAEIDDFRQILFVRCTNLKSLELRKCSFVEFSAPHHLEYREPAYGEQTNLKSLLIRPKYACEVFPMPWSELLTHFQELTLFRFQPDYFHDEVTDIEIDRILGAIKAIRYRNQKKLPLTTFELSIPLRVSRDPASHAKFDLLRELKLPLEDLKMEIHPEMSREDLKVMRAILGYHRNTIIDIDIIEMSPHFTTPPYSWTFPCQVELPKLLSLIVCHVDFGNMEFIKYTPNLGSLYVTESDNPYNGEVATDAVNTMVQNSRKPELELENIKLLNLTNLTFGYVLSDMDIESLIRWMPNVKVLGMVLNDKQFSIVCNNWKTLETLTVHGEDLTDEGITGISDKAGDESGHLATSDPPQAYITSLQGLENLSCILCQNITDVSVIHGFLKLPKLQFIHCLAAQQWGEEAGRCLEEKGVSVCDEWY